MEKMNVLKDVLVKRKLIFMLPVFMVPVLTILLMVFGVIGKDELMSSGLAVNKLNMNLPNAIPLKDSNWSKLKFYEQADKDSAKYQSLLKNDPYFSLSFKPEDEERDTVPTQLSKNDPFNSNVKNIYDPAVSSVRDANEEKVYKKLAELNVELEKHGNSNPPNDKAGKDNETTVVDAANSIDVNRLENMMKMMNGTETGGDPEMNKINGMLDKILDIQHPQRIKDELEERSEREKGKVFAVTHKDEQAIVTSFGSNKKKLHQNQFYSLKEMSIKNQPLPEGIKAIIPETQSLVSGSIVKLHLLNDIYVNGMKITKGQPLFGECSLTGERLEIEITSISFSDVVLPVALSVYDLDGLQGIYVPGTITRDVAKQSTDQALQGMNIASLDPSFGAQAATAGIQAAKSLIGKKAKLVRVTVKTGYQVLLRDVKQKN